MQHTIKEPAPNENAPKRSDKVLSRTVRLHTSLLCSWFLKTHVHAVSLALEGLWFQPFHNSPRAQLAPAPVGHKVELPKLQKKTHFCCEWEEDPSDIHFLFQHRALSTDYDRIPSPTSVQARFTPHGIFGPCPHQTKRPYNYRSYQQQRTRAVAPPRASQASS